jgi:hypothetical protein
MTKTEALSRHSSYVENALRHVFLCALFQAVWERDHTQKLHVYNNEVDDSGFDLVASLGNVVRHIQLKGTHTTGRARSVSAHVALSAAQGGCIVWVAYSAETLQIQDYRFFGLAAGEAIADISHLPAAMTQRRDIHGLRRARENHRIVKRADFTDPLTIHELLDALFSPNPYEPHSCRQHYFCDLFRWVRRDPTARHCYREARSYRCKFQHE